MRFGILGCFALAACSYTVEFVPKDAGRLPPPRRAEDVQLLSDRPATSHRVIGHLTFREVGRDPALAEKLRDTAGRHGCEAVYVGSVGEPVECIVFAESGAR